MVDRISDPDVDESLGPVIRWAAEHLSDPITVADLARYAHISVATLHRRFLAQLNTTPYAWLSRERGGDGLSTLEHGDLNVNAVASAAGLGTTATLRTLVRQETGLTPTAYRQRFALAGAGS